MDHNFNILKNSDIHGYNTRLRRNDFRLPLAKRNYGKQRLFDQCAREWNILDASFKGMNSLLLFKQNIKSCIFYSFSLFEKWAPCIKIVIVIIIVISEIQDLVVAQRVIRRSKRHTMDINIYSGDHSPLEFANNTLKTTENCKAVNPPNSRCRLREMVVLEWCKLYYFEV